MSGLGVGRAERAEESERAATVRAKQAARELHAARQRSMSTVIAALSPGAQNIPLLDAIRFQASCTYSVAEMGKLKCGFGWQARRRRREGGDTHAHARCAHTHPNHRVLETHRLSNSFLLEDSIPLVCSYSILTSLRKLVTHTQTPLQLVSS